MGCSTARPRFRFKNATTSGVRTTIGAVAYPIEHSFKQSIDHGTTHSIERLARCMAGVLTLAMLLSHVIGCALSQNPQTPSKIGIPEKVDAVVQVPTTYVTADDDGMIEVRMREASMHLMEQDYVRASLAYDRIVALEPKGKHASVALFNGAYAWEQRGQSDQALERYVKVFETWPDGAEASSALLRASRLVGRKEDWKLVASYGAQLVRRQDLSDIERVEALGALGLGLVEQGRIDEAAGHVTKARILMERGGFDQVQPISYGMAQVYFALGEVIRLRGELIGFVPTPRDFSDKLELRCQSLLDAQDAYAASMRANDAHWSTMAGYRIGSMYQKLHADMMQIQPPRSATNKEKKELFEGAMQLRYRVLLDKGAKMFDSTLAMVERTHHESAWVKRLKQAREQLATARRHAEDALNKLPYTEHQLQRALDDIAGKSTANNDAPIVSDDALKNAPDNSERGSGSNSGR